MVITLPPTPPTQINQVGTRVPAQDFVSLRRQALSSGGLFEDPYFPADDSSLFYSQKLPFTPEWKRPGVKFGIVIKLNDSWNCIVTWPMSVFKEYNQGKKIICTRMKNKEEREGKGFSNGGTFKGGIKASSHPPTLKETLHAVPV